jgi:hypothetical protein
MSKTFVIVALSDGDTYSGIGGCQILTITEEAMIALDSGEATIRDLELDSRNLILSRIELWDR